MNSNGFMTLDQIEEYDDHRLVTIVRDEETGLKGYIAFHRGGLTKPAFGATRIWPYQSETDALKDVLTLSKVMTYKSAMAGLPYGGAKAVIFSTKENGSVRNSLLRAYSQRVNYFSGHFITGADVGISPEDVKLMSTVSKFMVGVKSDPVKYTVLGVVSSLSVCLEEIFGTDDISNRTFAMQGLGKTGMGILEFLYPKAKKIYVADIIPNQIKKALQVFPNLEVVRLEEIYKQHVDVFMPCALSNTLNHRSISKLQSKVVVGSANSQLEDKEVGVLLHKLGILYAPDYVVNAGGLIAVVDEYEKGNSEHERVIRKVNKIKTTLAKIIAKSKRERRATNIVANEMAEKIFNKFV